LWLLAQMARPNLGFADGWSTESVCFNLGTGLVYGLIGILLWSGVRMRPALR
jgi:hypothetical protein